MDLFTRNVLLAANTMRSVYDSRIGRRIEDILTLRCMTRCSFYCNAVVAKAENNCLNMFINYSSTVDIYDEREFRQHSGLFMSFLTQSRPRSPRVFGYNLHEKPMFSSVGVILINS